MIVTILLIALVCVVLFASVIAFGQRKQKTILVPVPNLDPRKYEDKWQDDNYLDQVGALSTSPIYISEVTQQLARMRAIADSATCPEMLRGANCGVALLKELLTIGEKASGVKRGTRIKDFGGDAGYEFG